MLPGSPIEIYALLREDDVRWSDWVDVAAQTWKRIAEEYSVARYPSDEPPPRLKRDPLQVGHMAEIVRFPRGSLGESGDG